MTFVVKLKLVPPRDGDKRHGRWILRYWSSDAAKEIGETIGWYAPARDPWMPKHCKGPRLTRMQADEIRVQRRNDLRKGRIGQPEPAQEVQRANPLSIPFSQWIKIYMDETKDTVRETTLREIEQALACLDDIAKPVSAATVDNRTVKRFIQARRQSGVKSSTIWKQISALRRVWYDAGIDPNPWAQPKLRRQLKSIPKAWHWYGSDEFGRMMTKCDEWRRREDSAKRDGLKWLRFKALLVLSYTAGLRIGELYHLIWDDIDLDAGEIEIGPKNASDTMLTWCPKDHERRVVPLTPTAKDILRELVIESDDQIPYVFVTLSRYDYIMGQVAKRKWKQLRPLVNNVRRDFRALCEAAKVPVCTFHSLRKSCCTNLLEGRVAPHAVQKIMGHSSIETTINFYSKVRRDQIAVARDVAESYLPHGASEPTPKANSA